MVARPQARGAGPAKIRTDAASTRSLSALACTANGALGASLGQELGLRGRDRERCQPDRGPCWSSPPGVQAGAHAGAVHRPSTPPRHWLS